MNRPRPEPDFRRLRSTLLRAGPPGPVPAMEFLADVQIMEEIVGQKFPIRRLSDLSVCDREACERTCDLIVCFHRQLGFDYVCVLVEAPLASTYTAADDPALVGTTRYWQDQKRGTITSWADFEAYAWPALEDVNFRPMEYTAQHLPAGMQIVVACDGVFEWVKAMMGFETLALALMDDPELVAAMCQMVGELTVSICAAAIDVPNVGAFFLGDDMGYATATLVSPQHLREYVFPWQKRMADLVHTQGLPFLLHACGNLSAIMNDLIGYVGIDGKHSYEDKIMPVEDVMELWGNQMCIVGGLDMDLLARGTQEQVRTRTRQILDSCGPRGGYCLGTGNTVANYIPVPNYLAMLGEGRRWNHTHFSRP
jgi:uroporphyrinogen decarboxylase